MLPLKDSIPSERAPLVNGVIIVVCAAVFLFELTLGRRLDLFVQAFSFVPARFFHPGAFDTTLVFNLKTLVFSMFMHGGWLHLIGNMWFLWVFGDNVEDALGHVRYVLFYLVCGTAAALGQALVAPGSLVPMVGASGAIAGVLGAYLVWYPWARVKTLVFVVFFVTIIEIPAPFFLIFWFIMQFFSGTLSLAAATSGGGVAFFAHIGGFVAGAGIAWWLKSSGAVRPYPRIARW